MSYHGQATASQGMGDNSQPCVLIETRANLKAPGVSMGSTAAANLVWENSVCTKPLADTVFAGRSGWVVHPVISSSTTYKQLACQPLMRSRAPPSKVGGLGAHMWGQSNRRSGAAAEGMSGEEPFHKLLPRTDWWSRPESHRSPVVALRFFGRSLRPACRPPAVYFSSAP